MYIYYSCNHDAVVIEDLLKSFTTTTTTTIIQKSMIQPTLPPMAARGLEIQSAFLASLISKTQLKTSKPRAA